jgi:NRAMP (natural resistance-associated macrophage protein)-like metal ion transporter
MTAAVHRRLRPGPIASLAGVLGVFGPGLLAGLSDDDPAGITTYSILGAREGYSLLWVLALSTVALVIFHEVGARTGVVTGRGVTGLARDRWGRGPAQALLVLLLFANVGTTCAEFAGVAAGAGLAGIPRGLSVPLATVLVAGLLVRGSFHRVEHVLLALGTVFVAYIAAGILAHPDWGAAARGLVVPSLPGTRDGLLLVVATVGTTLAPWGVAFIQSYAVDKHLVTAQLRTERVDVIVGAVLTGIIGGFVVIACAATLHPRGVHVDDATQAAEALRPAAGAFATALFGAGLVGAALLASAVLPLATAYSVCEAYDRPAHLGRDPGTRFFRQVIVAVLVTAAVLVCIPGAPLVPILYLSQALNAVLLVPVLWAIRRLASDPSLMGDEALSQGDRLATGVALAAIAVAVAALGLLTVAR